MSVIARRAAAGAVAIALISGLVGWFVGRQGSSATPTTSEARASRTSLLTVAVESRTLSRDVVTRADATYGDEVEVTIVPDTSSGRRPIVTGKLPDDGEALDEGAVMIEIAGRPVFLLEGALPTFRSLTPGTTGVDVLQLEESLSRLGYFDGTPNDYYDEATEQAVTRLYESAGYSPPEIPPEELNQLRGAEDAVDLAQEQVELAQDAVDMASRSGTSEATGRVPVSALSARFNDYDSPGQERLDAAYANWVAAQEAYNTGMAQAEKRRQKRLAKPGSCPQCTMSPDEEYNATYAALSDAYNAAYVEYQDAYWSTEDSSGGAEAGSTGDYGDDVSPDSGGPFDGGADGASYPNDGSFVGDGADYADGTIPDGSFPEGADAGAYPEGADAGAYPEGADGSGAQGFDETTQLPDGADPAAGGYPDGATGYPDGATGSAPGGGETVDPTVLSDGRQERRQLERARDALNEAQVNLSEVRAEVGVGLPQSEFYFLSELPREVTDVMIELGDLVEGPVMTISGGGLTFSGGIAEISRPYVEVGDTAMIDDEASGSTIEVTITELADSPGTDGQTAERYYFEALPDDTVDNVDELIRIGNFRMVIPIERTEGEVIAVPLAALSAAPDGSSRVEIEQENGSTEFVDVVVGLEAEGYVEVTPVDQDSVAVDDLVVIGIDNGDSESG